MSLEQSFQNGIRMQAQMTVLVFLILIMTRNVSVGATTGKIVFKTPWHTLIVDLLTRFARTFYIEDRNVKTL